MQRHGDTRAAVRALVAAGVPRAEVARRLGLCRATVALHARGLGETPAGVREAPRVDWQAVQALYDAGASARTCMARFGLCPAGWSAAVARGVLRTRPEGA